jgi:hypothetical protein
MKRACAWGDDQKAYDLRAQAIVIDFFFGCFCRKFCHANLDSRKQQAILLKKAENFRPKFAFFLFFRRRKSYK